MTGAAVELRCIQSNQQHQDPQNLNIRWTTKERNSVETIEIKRCSNKQRFYMLIKRLWCIFTYFIAGLKTAIWWECVFISVCVHVLCCVSVYESNRAWNNESNVTVSWTHCLRSLPPLCWHLHAFMTLTERVGLWACVSVWLWHFIVIFSPRQCQRKSGWPSPSFWSCGSQHWPPLL